MNGDSINLESQKLSQAFDVYIIPLIMLGSYIVIESTPCRKEYAYIQWEIHSLMIMVLLWPLEQIYNDQLGNLLEFRDCCVNKEKTLLGLGLSRSR